MSTLIRCITYGLGEYCPAKFEEISDEPFRNKPRGGLWSSPIDSEFGWKDWCIAEEWREDTLGSWFTFDFVGSVLVIDGPHDAAKLPWIEDGRYDGFISFQAMCCPDFYYDAIYLTEQGQELTRYTNRHSLYGWDCESLLIMNPNSIVNVDNSMAAKPEAA